VYQNIKINSNNCSLVPIIVGVSGHRDIMDNQREILTKLLVDYINNEIIKKYPNTPIILMSPLAEGADRLFAKLINLLRVESRTKIDLVVPLPMPIEEYVKDFKTGESKKEFYELLSKSKYYYELPIVKEETLDSISKNQESRDKQYEQLGAYIVNKCQFFVALWDGIYNNSVGGTSNNVKFRLDGIPDKLKDEKNIFNARESGQVFHILTPRSNSDIKKKYLTTSTLSPNYIRREIEEKYVNENTKTDEFKMTIEKEMEKKGNNFIHKICLNIDKLNSDIIKQNKKMNNNLDLLEYNIFEDSSNIELKEKIKSFIGYFGIIDNLAIKNKKIRDFLVKIILFLLVTAIFCFQIYLEFFSYPFVLALYPLTLVLGMVVFLIANRKEFDRKHEDYRAIAEGLRIQYYWLLGNINANVSDHYLNKHTGELEWIRQCVRNIQINCNIELAKLQNYTNEDEILSGRVSNSWINGQLDWFKRKSKYFEQKNIAFEKASNKFFIIGMTFAFLLLILKLFINSDETIIFIKESTIHHIFVVMIGTSIAIMAALRGYAESMAFEEISKQYSRMANIFYSVKKRFSVNNDMHYRKIIMYRLGEEALIENGDWLLMHRSHPIEPPKG